MNLSALAVAVLVAAPGPKDPPKKEPPTIVGEWTCVEAAYGGQKATPAELRQLGVEFTADGKFRAAVGGRPEDGTFTTDPKKDPAEIDVVGDKNGKKAVGIYKVEKDTLNWCKAETGGARPTKFESPAGSRILLITFRRMEKKKE